MTPEARVTTPKLIRIVLIRNRQVCGRRGRERVCHHGTHPPTPTVTTRTLAWTVFDTASTVTGQIR